ncbi:MAG TPA: ASPIC/UnbV domain-containing protein, partial [Cryomorphaceae bacterium]|nr:ASPIC/UnbV domain-containing protein [Cryomorphaceae bacterium]
GEQVILALNATDPSVVGNPTIELNSAQPRIYINFDPVLEKWTVTAKSGLGASIPFGLEVESSDLVLTDNFPQGPNLGAELFYNTGDYSFAEQIISVFDESDNFESVVAADFDNDMDIDLYAVRTNNAKNMENVLWENDNNLSWVRHDGAWGAIGNGEGIGESVTTVDYNNDGFMDLYVTNGSSIFWLEEASTNLYENQADNGNNWLKVQLEGVTSTPQGLHAKVILHAGGVSQLRYQHGGMHRYSQNDTRLHFGLAQNTMIDSLEVFWPSGIRQVITDTDVNLILTITEETACEIPYPGVIHLTSSILPNGVLLEWDPIPGSIGCQIQGGLSSSTQFMTFQILEPDASEFFAPQGQLQNGEEYRWRVRCGCTTSIVGPWSEIDYFIWPSAGFQFAGQVEDANLFPNPSHSDIFVDISSFGNETYTMEIFDLQGRVVKANVGKVESNHMLRFDISDLDTGVYLVRISDGSSLITEKIVKE